jgi:hypothetical protein
MQFHGFDWDEGNVAKCQKHGLSVEEIESLFERGIFALPVPPGPGPRRLPGPIPVTPDVTAVQTRSQLRKSA